MKHREFFTSLQLHLDVAPATIVLTLPPLKLQKVLQFLLLHAGHKLGAKFLKPLFHVFLFVDVHHSLFGLEFDSLKLLFLLSRQNLEIRSLPLQRERALEPFVLCLKHFRCFIERLVGILLHGIKTLQSTRSRLVVQRFEIQDAELLGFNGFFPSLLLCCQDQVLLLQPRLMLSLQFRTLLFDVFQ
uniref:Uncharacterized protein n=1 Tax=Globisporangium ultimum (strain ATCC 200006 / CBS 805.95 / DAOM BR144) TaxID=431595 RepID=K3WZ93_GLOUD